MASCVPRTETSPPTSSPDPPGERNFASCVALGRIFGATFRNACPPTRAQLRPRHPKAAGQSRAQAGGQRQRLRRNTYPGQCKTRSVSPDFRSWPTSPDKKKYTPCENLAKACTFFCPDLLANAPTGRSFAQVGRNFSVTFRSAPRPRAAPLFRLRAAGTELRVGGGRFSEGCAEIPT